MFGKITHESIKRTMQNVKSHVGHGYNHLKRIAHNVDHGFNVAKQVYSVLEPTIRHIAGNNPAHGHVMKAISGYESLRNKVFEGQNHLENVGHKLGGLI